MNNLSYKDITIVYEDNHLLVVVKPQNIPVCSDDSGDPNLLDMLKEYLKVTYNKTGDAFLGLVHRLDRPTGGVMVFAKTSKCASRLHESMLLGELEKKYYAVTVGAPKNKRGILENMLYKDEAKNEVYVVPYTTTGAKKAILEYSLVNEAKPLALVDVKLLTGRSHQARVQLAAIGTPIIGDKKYGKGNAPVAPYLALWARELRFPHPVTRETMVFRVVPPLEIFPWNKFNAAIFNI